MCHRMHFLHLQQLDRWLNGCTHLIVFAHACGYYFELHGATGIPWKRERERERERERRRKREKVVIKASDNQFTRYNNTIHTNSSVYVNIEFFSQVLNVHSSKRFLDLFFNSDVHGSIEITKMSCNTSFPSMIVDIAWLVRSLKNASVGVLKYNSLPMTKDNIIWRRKWFFTLATNFSFASITSWDVSSNKTKPKWRKNRRSWFLLHKGCGCGCLNMDSTSGSDRWWKYRGRWN